MADTWRKYERKVLPDSENTPISPGIRPIHRKAVETFFWKEMKYLNSSKMMGQQVDTDRSVQAAPQVLWQMRHIMKIPHWVWSLVSVTWWFPSRHVVQTHNAVYRLIIIEFIGTEKLQMELECTGSMGLENGRDEYLGLLILYNFEFVPIKATLYV